MICESCGELILEGDDMNYMGKVLCEYVKVNGEVTPEALAQEFQLSASQLQREFTTLRHKDAQDRYLSKQALFELTVFHDAIQDAFDVHFAQHGLSEPKFKVLIHLYMAGDRGLIQSELGTKLQVSRANITGLVERLEKEGLVVRNNDNSDKRVFRVCLTNRAFALMHAFLPVHNDSMYKVVASLNNSEKEVLISLLKKLNKGLESI